MGLSNYLPNSRISQSGVVPNEAGRPVSPYTGQVIYQLDTLRTLVWNGVAWVDLSTGTTNQPGLELIKKETITSGTSKEITGAFSADYTNYRIIITNIVTSTVEDTFMRMGTTSSGYYTNSNYGQYNSSTFSSGGLANTSRWDIGLIPNTSVGASCVVDLQNPQTAQITTYESRAVDVRTTGRANITAGGFLNNSTQYTSFTLFNNTSATFSSCDISVYGYRK
jgi:hypothetical protein